MELRAGLDLRTRSRRCWPGRARGPPPASWRAWPPRPSASSTRACPSSAGCGQLLQAGRLGQHPEDGQRAPSCRHGALSFTAPGPPATRVMPAKMSNSTQASRGRLPRLNGACRVTDADSRPAQQVRGVGRDQAQTLGSQKHVIRHAAFGVFHKGAAVQTCVCFQDRLWKLIPGPYAAGADAHNLFRLLLLDVVPPRAFAPLLAFILAAQLCFPRLAA